MCSGDLWEILQILVLFQGRLSTIKISHKEQSGSAHSVACLCLFHHHRVRRLPTLSFGPLASTTRHTQQQPAMSSALQWKIVRKFNKFQHVNSSGDGRVFSKEPTNLKNINSPRFSGIVNAKAIGLKAGPKGGAIVITKTKKAAVCPKKGFQGVALRRGARPTNRAVANVARCLRPDLKRAAVARASALILASKPKSGSKKSRSGRKSRKSRK